MHKKNKELIRDIMIMAYGFIGSGIFFWLFVLSDLNYLTGNTIREIAGFVNFSFGILGFAFIGIVALLLIIKKLIKGIKKYE